MTFGLHLRTFRKQRGYSQRALAAKCLVSYAHICRIEKGYVPPSLMNIGRFAAALGVDPHELAKLAVDDVTARLYKSEASAND